MVHCLIIGGAGMLGSGLAARLARTGKLGDRAVSRLTLFDVVAPGSIPEGGAVSVGVKTGDIARPETVEALVAARPDVIFHLAAIVSGEAERDFEKGYRINLDGTRNLFEAVRKAHESDGYHPRIVFTSSLAVFGSPLPDVIDDDHILTPRSSYGTQKAICELLLADYSRRGYFDGIGIRLPTICIRPGKPNAAASGFFSSILREPLAGLPAVLPVDPSVRHWFASPRAAVGFIAHAATVDSALLDERRNLTMPGVSATVADEIEALRAVAGDSAVELIRHEIDPAVVAIISTWPKAFDARRAEELGFTADKSFAAIIEAHIEDHAADRETPA
ncbi:D-erythronate dehydrogenase [Frigidibacter sp. ROC022]|uniref:D-erythronate dehydrogenase n=1 Tax=Frigidibacter sp. ROC022 TaxID=2971796 RepID=UPI00215B08F3|nr:D-erythronate dehydrogenase [Frigidibacter sp. ROC022]MCR8724563.1 SDR family oxidoreductase [Frigidibacter sp. ROC022]